MAEELDHAAARVDAERLQKDPWPYGSIGPYGNLSRCYLDARKRAEALETLLWEARTYVKDSYNDGRCKMPDPKGARLGAQIDALLGKA